MINKNTINKIFIVTILFTMILTATVFADDNNYFTIKVPKGYQVAQDSSGPTKFVAEREDGKINFNVQVYDAETYYEYSQKGLNDLIRIASKEMGAYYVGKVEGSIGTIGEYPCYDLNYKITVKENDKEMYVRQIYLYEDTYSYILTFGGESAEILNNEEVQETLNSFTIEHYKRDNVEEAEKEEKISSLLIVILAVMGVSLLAFIIKVVVVTIKNKNKKPKKVQKVKAKIETIAEEDK